MIPDESLHRLGKYKLGLLVNSDLDSWKVLRKCLVESIGRPKFLKGLVPKIGGYLAELTDSLDRLADAGVPILVNELMGLVSMDIILNIIFSEKREAAIIYGDGIAEGKKVKPDPALAMVHKVMDAGGFYGKVPPFIYKYILRGKDKLHRESVLQWMRYTEERVRQKQTEVSASTNNEHMDFATSLFLTAESLCPDQNTVFKQVVSTIRETIGGGTDTSSNTMAFLIYELARNKALADQISDEVVRAVDASGIIDHDSLSRMPFLEAAITEIGRTCSLVAGLTRYLSEDTLVDGMVLKKGAHLVIANSMNHSDPEVWENPQLFDPTRFMKKPAKPEGPHGFGWAFSPFGYGVRRCPGQELALIEMKIVMATLCRRYRFRLADPLQSLEIHESSVRECGPLPIIFEKREHNQ
ncbi:cytochrome P450 [Rhizoclosmatium globosum]|uniref:Cytochrome P450 n=1 Tax=Rhizoclosmatium globosum TaxID=329046 RepID=A0A1Y2D323_9FUNG|nr:cytochrome P450 [Rhizoclosmatium globosum]|eukprot:ORY53689.1 cytochrome P450 [Rhizoclosmatium globosum]